MHSKEKFVGAVLLQCLTWTQNGMLVVEITQSKNKKLPSVRLEPTTLAVAVEPCQCPCLGPLGHNLIFFKALTILVIANPTLPFLQCGIKQHTLEVYLGTQKYCSEVHHIYIILVVSVATEKLHNKAHFLSMLCESKGCSFTAGLFRPSSSSYNFENAGFRFCM